MSIDGGDTIPLVYPDFSSTQSFETGFEYSISFALNGEDVKGSPVTISVVSDLNDAISTEDIYIIAFSALFGGFFVYAVFKYTRLDADDLTLLKKQGEMAQSFLGIFVNICDHATFSSTGTLLGEGSG